MSMKTYWSNNGTYQSDYDRLVKLMPAMGKCETVAGEIIRAACRLGYDFYNNGMGNNTSGAANYLFSQGIINRHCYETVYEYSRGRVYDGSYGEDALHKAIVECTDKAIECILDNPDLETELNEEDIFDYEDEDESFCDECGCSMGDSRGWICEDCEYLMEEEEY